MHIEYCMQARDTKYYMLLGSTQTEAVTHLCMETCLHIAKVVTYFNTSKYALVLIRFSDTEVSRPESIPTAASQQRYFVSS